MKKTLTTLVVLATTFCSAQAQQQPVYLDETKPIEQRVNDALSRMTLNEKIRVIHAQSKFSAAGVPRLGMPDFWTDDGPHGVRPDVLWDEWVQAGQTMTRVWPSPHSHVWLLRGTRQWHGSTVRVSVRKHAIVERT